ncbi:MAG: hypothetical protein EBU66_15890 [Bacteroidetes bacterium]|nr:hypothetical protein [Bacteroidota bacterium]
MKRNELIREVAKTTDIPTSEARRIVEMFDTLIEKVITSHESVLFGNIIIRGKRIPARTATHNVTKETYTIPEHTTAVVKLSPKFKNILKQRG